MNYENLQFEVSTIATRAGNVLLELQPRAREQQLFGKDFVTDADSSSHKLICSWLSRLTPNIRIYSEEGDEEFVQTNDPQWIVDPLDGSVNYFHQDFAWGVSIALSVEGKTKLAAVNLPALRQLVVGGPVNGTSTAMLEVRKDTDLARAQIWTDWPKANQNKTLKIFGKLSNASLYPQLRLCTTYSLLMVAFGKIAGYIHPGPKPEDFSAAALFVERAGGIVTDLKGQPWTPWSNSIVASCTRKLHEKLLDILS